MIQFKKYLHNVYIAVYVVAKVITLFILLCLIGLAIILKPFTECIVDRINKKLYGKNGIYGDSK